MAFVMGRGRCRGRSRTATTIINTIIVDIHDGVLIVEEVGLATEFYCAKEAAPCLVDFRNYVVPQLRVEDFRRI